MMGEGLGERMGEWLEEGMGDGAGGEDEGQDVLWRWLLALLWTFYGFVMMVLGNATDLYGFVMMAAALPMDL